MNRRECLKCVTIAMALVTFSQLRVSAAREPFDALCDERGVCLVSEDGARLICVNAISVLGVGTCGKGSI
jgi:hypothetical protein